MRYIKYEFENIEPIKITNVYMSKSGENAVLNYIPGSTIRGMILQTLSMADSPKADFETFKRVLLSDKVSFMNAYPVCDGETLIPSPKGFYEAKKQTGFLQNVVVTGEFDEGFKRADLGQFCRLENEELKYMSVNKQDALNIVVESKDIFRSESICSHYQFRGFIAFEDDIDMSPVCEILNKADFRIGSSRTAGYGHIKIIACENNCEIFPYQEFSLSDEPQTNIVYMMLLSPTSMRSDSGELCGLNIESLEKLLHVKELSVQAASTSVVKVSGFNRMWNARTPEYTMYEPGSVFKLEFQGELTREAMQNIEARGIGIGRNEGHGRVLFIKGYADIQKKSRLSMRTVKDLSGDLNVEISQEEKEEIQRIAAMGMMKNKIEYAMNKYIVSNQLELKGASKSQLGVFLAMCKNLRYSGADAIKVLQNHMSHIENKQKSERRQTGKEKNQTHIMTIIQNILNNDFYETIGLDGSSKCCQIPVEDIFDDKAIVGYKLLLIEQMITYANRGGK